jgi:hypothetical protein
VSRCLPLLLFRVLNRIAWDRQPLHGHKESVLGTNGSRSSRYWRYHTNTITIASPLAGRSTHASLPVLLVTQECFLYPIVPIHELVVRVRWKLFMRSSHGYTLETEETGTNTLRYTRTNAHRCGQQACEPKR